MGRTATSHHSHDFHLVTLAQGHRFVSSAIKDLAVVLDRHGARIHAEPIEIREQRDRCVQLHALAVDLQLNHWNIPIAAKPAAPAA
jgi:hypothetical protein